MKLNRFLLLLSLLVGVSAKAQVSSEALEAAYIDVDKGEFARALPLLKSQHRFDPASPKLNYYLGLVYLNSPNQKLKAIPFFEYAIPGIKDKIVPAETYYYLGILYRHRSKFLKSIESFNQYIETTKFLGPVFRDASRQIAVTQNAITFTKNPINTVTVDILDFPINTSYDDYSPLLSSNDNLMIFSSNRPTNTFNLVFGEAYTYLPTELSNTKADVYMATRRSLTWGFPEPQEFDSEIAIPLSLLQRGTEMSMLLYMGNSLEEGGLYLTNVKKQKWQTPKRIDGGINSKYAEKSATFANAGQAIIFSSNREGGLGGYDLYKSVRVGKNSWSEPENMGSVINTEYDEVSPFMQSDGKTLYFSSNGHNTIGGLDVFETRMLNGRWSTPGNLGFPINSTFDDKDFVESADRKNSYLSTNRNSSMAFGGWDIIHVFRPVEKVPRAIVTGSMIARKDGRSIPLRIEMTDLNEDKRVNYIYDPDPETGKFFAIAQPKTNYLLRIMYGLEEIYKLNIDIPENTYEYQIFQELDVSDVSLLGKKVGLDIIPIRSDFKVTRIKEADQDGGARNLRYDVLDGLIEMIVDRTDVEGLTRLNDIEQPVVFAENKSERGRPIQYFTTLEALVEQAIETSDVGLLLSLDKMRGDMGPKVVYSSNNGMADKPIEQLELFFKKGQVDLERVHMDDLVELADFLRDHRTIKLTIYFEVPIGSSITELNKRRAQSIEQYLIGKEDIEPFRINVIGEGMAESSDSRFNQNKLTLNLYDPLAN